jgi:hypothetical protein
MKRYLFALLIVGLFAVQGHCQDNQSPVDQNSAQASATTVMPAPTAPEKTPQPQEASIYGEVKAVNPAAGSVTIQYYDYDSDEEKTIDITADSATKMENAATINDVKQGNWADVIYSAMGGKNVAKSIIVEKEEEAPAAEMPASVDKPQETPAQ